MKQGIDANIQSMSQAEKTLLRYQYVMSNTSAAQGDFSRTALTWANQTRVLKQNLEQLASTIGGTLINAFKPLVKALNVAMGYINSFAKTVSNALGKIFGWTYEEGGGFADEWGSAASSSEDIADSTGKASKNIKKMQAGLRAFDELKTINMPDDNPSSGGGGAGGNGIGDLGADIEYGEWVQTDSIFKGYESEIDTLSKLGEYIGTTLTDAMNSIDWDSIYKKAENFGSGLASFLNGLISPELFGSVGKTISNSLNTALKFLDSFGKTFDFKNFGTSIGTGINKALKNIKWKTALTNAKTYGKGIATTLNSFLEKTDFELIGGTVAGFINTAIIFSLSSGKKIDFKSIGKKIASGINESFKKLKAKELAESISTWVIGALTLVATFFKETDFQSIGNKIGEFLSSLDIGKAIDGLATVIWEAIKSAFELLIGLFQSAPLETLLLAAFALLKFTSIGNSVATSLFNSLKSSIPSSLSGLGGTIKDGLTKATTTALTGLAEFSITSNTFEGLITGSEDLVTGILKIGSESIISAKVMYDQLGPAGIAIAAVTGLAGAIKGIKDAFDTIRAEEIGISIKNAMSNPGGTPIGELAQGISDALSKASSGFTELNTSSKEVTSINKNIQSVVSEIEEIKKAMDLGVLSVQEGTEKLDGLFSQLVELTGQKMSVLTTHLLELYGEGGALSNAYHETEYSSQQVTDAVIRTQYATTDAAKAIYEQMREVDFGSSEWNNLYQQLIDVSTGMEDFEKAAFIFSDNMKSLEGKINWDDIILPDGSVNTEELDELLLNISTNLENYNKVLDEAEESTKLHWMEMLTKAATPEDRELFQQLLNDVPDQFEKMREDAKAEVVQFTDMIQLDLIDGLSDVIKNSQNKWGEKGFVGKLFSFATEETYVKEAADKQKENIKEVSDSIQSALGDLEINSPAWAESAIEALYEQLFNREYHFSITTAGGFVYALNEDFENVINKATEGISELAQERGEGIGKNIVDGEGIGIEKNTKTATDAAESFTQKVLDKIAEVQDSHSPSKVTEALGKDAVDGYNLGISKNSEVSTTEVKTWMSNIKDTITDSFSGKEKEFSSPWTVIKELVSDTMKEVSDTISEKMKNSSDTIKEKLDTIKENFSSIMDKAKKIVSNGIKEISNSFSTAKLELPKVKLPHFSINGSFSIESKSVPTVSVNWYATGGYIPKSYTLIGAGENGIPEIMGTVGGKSAIAGGAEITGIRDAIYSSSSLELQLLREQNQLLGAILRKPTLGNDDVFNAAKSTYKREATRRYGNSAYFDPIWG